MTAGNIHKALRFCFIIDDNPSINPLPAEHLVKTALKAGATMIRYRNESFSPLHLEQVETIRNLCKCNCVPFIICNNILLAKAVSADGLHICKDYNSLEIAKKVLGIDTLVGVTVSGPDELEKTGRIDPDYMEICPLFSHGTYKKNIHNLSDLKLLAENRQIPVTAAGGITASNAKSCFLHGAFGVASCSFIAKSDDPFSNAVKLARACGCSPRGKLYYPWNDEFTILKEILSKASSINRQGSCLKIRPGDDAALLVPLNRPVITTDTQIESVHFRLQWQTPEEIGNKAVEVTLSDLAASYATPLCLFVNLGLPPDISDNTVDALYKGIQNGLLRHSCELGGGNISRSARLSLDLFAIGKGHDEIFPTRFGAKPGFGLYCTGHLGLARAGLLSLIKKDMRFKKLILKFKFPLARFDAAAVLAENCVESVMDISDGLAGDAMHLAEASGISIEIDISSCSFDNEFLEFCRQYSLVPGEVFVSGGEDYELLFACPEEKFKNIKKVLPEVLQVGRCVKFNGKYLHNLPLKAESFRHRGNIFDKKGYF